MALTEPEEQMWNRIRHERGAEGVPRVVCSTITPFPFWAVIASIVIFIPLALIVAFFVSRQAILVQGGRLVVLDLSFWRYRITGERANEPLAPGAATLEGESLRIDGVRYHLQPGWRDVAERLVELCEKAPGERTAA